MEISQMTVAAITEMLAAGSISKDELQALEQDPRVSVSRLLHRWKQRELDLLQEKQRVFKLYDHERRLYAQGYQQVAGVDEAGRGPLAGPVVVAAVILPLNHYLPLLNDSKKLTAKQREGLYDAIKDVAVAVKHIVIDIDKIDEVNIYQATVFGMYQSLAGLTPSPQAVLIDAVPLPKLSVPSDSIIGGDAISASIAAASIIAKVERDRIMDQIDMKYPQYGFVRHKGYGTAEHMLALKNYGPCPIHRRSFEPIKSWGEHHGDNK